MAVAPVEWVNTSGRSNFHELHCDHVQNWQIFQNLLKIFEFLPKNSYLHCDHVQNWQIFENLSKSDFFKNALI